MKAIIAQIWIALFSVMGMTGAVIVGLFSTPTLFAQSPIPVTPQQIDEIANKSDRWLFIAALVLLLGFGALVVKWLLAQLDKQREANALANDKLIAHLQNESAASKLSLDKNTVALERNSSILLLRDKNDP